MSGKHIHYRDLKAAIRDRFKEFLAAKAQDDCLILPSKYDGKYSFESLSEYGRDEWITFSLVVSGDSPEDLIVILEAVVNRLDGTVAEWRCNNEAFTKSLQAHSGGA